MRLSYLLLAVVASLVPKLMLYDALVTMNVLEGTPSPMLTDPRLEGPERIVLLAISLITIPVALFMAATRSATPS